MSGIKFQKFLLCFAVSQMLGISAGATIILPFGREYNTSNSSYWSNTVIYVDTNPIRAGLEKLAQAMRESYPPEYMANIKKRYPDLGTYGIAIGLSPDRAGASEFVRDYGKAAYEKEVETRLTELQENFVIAANIARAIRGDAPIANVKELTANKESLYPFKLQGLVQLINHVRHHMSNHNRDGYQTSQAQPIVPANFRSTDLFDQKAMSLISSEEQAALTRALVSGLYWHVAPGTFARVTYDNLNTSKAEIVEDAAVWSAALSNGFGAEYNGPTGKNRSTCATYLQNVAEADKPGVCYWAQENLNQTVAKLRDPKKLDTALKELRPFTSEAPRVAEDIAKPLGTVNADAASSVGYSASSKESLE